MAEQNVIRPRGAVLGVGKASWWDRLWQPFWMIPAVLAIVAAALGVMLPELDRALRDWVLWAFPGGPDAARGALTTIASVTISTVGVVFSITMVVLQLAASQFTPRVVGPFLQNRIVQTTFGFFVATFVFSLIVLRSVLAEDEGQDGFVPRVSVSFAFVLVMVCVGLFLAFIRSITESIRVTTVVSRIGDATMALIDRVIPGDEPSGAGPEWAPSPESAPWPIGVDSGHGHIDEIDLPGLVKLARERDGVVILDRRLGDFVTRGQHLATYWGHGWEESSSRSVNALLRLTSERSLRQDLTFGFRQLVDIADRALSPGINDPTTATEVVNELHRLFREMVQRIPPSRYVVDEDGVVRVVTPVPDVTDTMRHCIQEIAHYGHDAAQVSWALASMLDDLTNCALPLYRGEIAALRGTLPDTD